MDCLEIKLKMSEYLNHSLNETETSAIEEHLCVCNSCREQLSQFMDEPVKPVLKPSAKKIETLKQETALPIKKSQSAGFFHGLLEQLRLKMNPSQQTKPSSHFSKTQEKIKTPVANTTENKLTRSELAKNNFADYAILAIGLTILIFFIFLLLKK